jgi:hypothetical protein
LTVQNWGSIAFVNDPKGNANSAVNTNQTSFIMPSDIYVCGSFSFMAYVYIDRKQSIYAINQLINIGNGNKIDQILWYINGYGQTFAYVYRSATWYSGNQLASSCDVQLSTWSHVAWTFDGTTSVFYINGNLCDSLPMTVSPTCVVRSNCFMGTGTIGTPSATYDGSYGMFDWRIYNRAISPNEIFDVMKHPPEKTIGI